MKRRNWAWGVFFLLVAALIIGVHLGYVPGLSTWRVIISALLGAMMLQSLFYLEFFGVFVPLAVIGILFDGPLGIEALTPWPILAAAVCLSIGFHILFRGAVQKRRGRCWGGTMHTHYQYGDARAQEEGGGSGEHAQGEAGPNAQKEYKSEYSSGGHSDQKEGGEARETIMDDNIECEVTFGAGIKYLHSKNLRHARFECSFGSLKVFFDQAKLSDTGAYVNVECSFASVELFVPRGWKVVDKITPTLGRVKHNFNAPQNEENALILTGNVQFGNVEIIYI